MQNEDKKKEKIIRNFNFLKENIIKEEETNNNKEKEKDDLIKNKQRSSSTVPHKNRKKLKKLIYKYRLSRKIK